MESIEHAVGYLPNLYEIKRSCMQITRDSDIVQRERDRSEHLSHNWSVRVLGSTQTSVLQNAVRID